MHLDPCKILYLLHLKVPLLLPMKKVFLIILSIAILIIILFFIPVERVENLSVKGDYSTLAQQLNDHKNWMKWSASLQTENQKPEAAFASKDSDWKYAGSGYFVKMNNPLSFSLSEKADNESPEYAFFITPSLKEDNFTIVVHHRQHIASYLLENPENNTGFLIASRMKEYMENPGDFYGFPIEMATTIDLNVITIKDTIASGEKRQRLQEMYHALDRFMQHSNLTQVQKRIAYFKPYKNDSLIIMSGIAVNELPKSNGEIEAVQMPEARILKCRYRGTYEKISAAYSALEDYIKDHKLQKIALPFERYLNDSIPASDSSLVEIDVYYPIR